MIARAKVELGDPRGAAETLAEAITRHPNDLELVEQCARHRLSAGDAAGALELVAPLEADASPRVAKIIARAKSHLGDMRGAAETIAQAIVRHPGDPELVEPHARNLLDAGDARGAVALLAAHAESLSAVPLVLLARATSELGDVGAAESIMASALERLPGDPILLGHLAELRLNAGRSRDAVTLLSPIEDVAPPTELLLLAKARLFSGDPAGGLATLERAQKRHPSSEAILQGLAAARVASGDPKEALAVLDRVPAPRGVQWFIARANSYEALGDVPGIEATIRQGLEVHPGDISLLSQLSKSLSSQGKVDEAHVIGLAIEDAVIAKPNNLAGLVQSYFLFGDAQGAAEFMSRILSKLETLQLNRTSVQALINLVPGARMLLPDLGIPLLKRILARLDSQNSAITVELQIHVATACGVVGDLAALRRRISEMIPSLERATDILEALCLATWANDEPALAALGEAFRAAVKRENVPAPQASAVASARLFSDRELGVVGFATGGSDVAFLFSGLYDRPSEVQRTLVLGLLARGVDVIPLFDLRRDVLLSGVGPAARNRRESFDALRRLISERGYRRTICVGTSGGGMPAAVYGDAIGADRIVVFSTGTFFPPDDDPLERRARAFLDKVRKPGLDIGTDNLEIWRQPGRHPELHIHYPSANLQDARHALRMQDLPEVTLYPVETARHGFFLTRSPEELATNILGPP